jgi:pimeloyl-ACP methyl ester carboxylesterase
MTINTQCIRYILSRWDENTIGSICIIYYDNLVNDKERLSKISWPVLGIFGAQDQSIPVDTVKQFEQALKEVV